MKTRILFVDDDESVVEALRRGLRGMQGVWEMTFVASAEDALSLIRREPFDVVMSDMRMPLVDGAHLMYEMRQRQPHAVRIALSGYAEHESPLRAVGLVHGYLAKPAGSREVTAAIVRASALREHIAAPRVRELVGDHEKMPAWMSRCQDLMHRLAFGEVPLQAVGEQIEKHEVLTRKILQVAASPMFEYRSSTSDVNEAVRRLGLNGVRAVLLAHGAFENFDDGTLPRADTDALWESSVTCGMLAARIGNQISLPEYMVDESFAAGLLHDIGRLRLAGVDAAEFASVLGRERDDDVDATVAERDVFGESHAAIGAFLASAWGLSDGVIEAIAFHHEPWRAPAPGISVLTVVHIAASVLGEGSGRGALTAAPLADQAYLSELGLSDQTERWRDLCKTTASS